MADANEKMREAFRQFYGADFDHKDWNVEAEIWSDAWQAALAEQPAPGEVVAWYDGKKFYGSTEAAVCDCADMPNLRAVYYAPPAPSEQPAQGEAVAEERLRKEFEVMLQCANWTGGHRDINFDRDEWDEYESYPVHISWNVYLRAIARPAPPPPSEQPAQGEAVAKAKLWDTLNAALMSRSGITLDNERDCYEAARQWAEAHGDAWSYKTAVQKLREERDTIAKLKVEALTLAAPPAPVVPSIFRSVQDAKKNAQTSLAEDEYSALLKKLSGRDFYLLQRAMLAADPEVKP